MVESRRGDGWLFLNWGKLAKSGSLPDEATHKKIKHQPKTSALYFLPVLMSVEVNSHWTIYQLRISLSSQLFHKQETTISYRLCLHNFASESSALPSCNQGISASVVFPIGNTLALHPGHKHRNYKKKLNYLKITIKPSLNSPLSINYLHLAKIKLKFFLLNLDW